MTQNEKDLLIKDLCARLPYGVILNCCNIVSETLTLIDYKGLVNNDYDIDEVKPYLFPLSSMTEEQNEKALSLLKNCDYYLIDGIIKWLDNCPIEFFDWCNKHHFDYRDLIPMGLANDATGLNIY